MRVAGNWLEDAQPVFAALSAYQTLVVGGAVRNALLGRQVADVDIATAALPDQVIAAAEAAGLRAVPTGLDHGTVTVILRGTGYEVTTFRRDTATDGRHATVAFSRDIAEDAARRDFTMNALYALPSGEVVDPLGGLPDLLARRVRFVGAADARIREDYLRILRFFRFAAWYGDPDVGLDQEGLAACAALSEGLLQLSRERIGAEMTKLLLAPDPAPAVAAMAASGVLARVLPGADHTALTVLVHLEGDDPPDAIRRLAVLGGEVDLRLSRAESRRLALLRETALQGGEAGELGYRLGAQAARDAGLVRAALLGQPLPEGWSDAAERGAQAVCPVRADDLDRSLTGRAIGDRLRELEAIWIASGFTLTREELLDRG